MSIKHYIQTDQQDGLSNPEARLSRVPAPSANQQVQEASVEPRNFKPQIIWLTRCSGAFTKVFDHKNFHPAVLASLLDCVA